MKKKVNHTIYLQEDVYNKLMEIKRKYEEKTGLKLKTSEVLKRILEKYIEIESQNKT